MPPVMKVLVQSHTVCTSSVFVCQFFLNKREKLVQYSSGVENFEVRAHQDIHFDQCILYVSFDAPYNFHCDILTEDKSGYLPNRTKK